MNASLDPEIGPLLLRPVYGADETPLSFLSRLAWRNAKGARRFCSDFGIHLQDVVDGQLEALTRLAQLGGVPPGRLLGNAMVRQGRRHYTWRGQRIGVSALRRLRPRICPLCLCEDSENAGRELGPEPHGRTSWQVAHLRTCPAHSVLLVELPSSSATMHDFAATLMQLPPGLLNSGAMVMGRATTDFERYLLSRLSGTPDPKAPWLNAIDFTAAAELCEAMGAVIAFGRRVGVLGLDEASLQLAGDLGFQVARQGPGGISEMLAAWDAGDGDDGSIAGPPCNAYGPFHTLLFGRHRRPELDPVRDAVVDHIVRTTPVGPGDVVHGRSVAQRFLHSIASASRETGTSVVTLRRVLREEGAIDAASDGRNANAVLFDATAHASLLGLMKHAILGEALGPHLGCSAKVARLLVDSGLVHPIRPGDVATGVPARLFDVASLDRLLRGLSNRAETMADERSGTCGIPAAARRANCPVAAVVAMILAGELAWVGRREGATGLAAIRVRVSEIKRLTGRGDADVMTPPEVGEEIGIGYRRTSALIDAGLIAARRAHAASRRGSPRMVTKGEVRRFRATFVTLGQLGRELGLHPNRCRRVLRDAGVQPTFVSVAPPVSVYRRAEVARILGDAHHQSSGGVAAR